MMFRRTLIAALRGSYQQFRIQKESMEVTPTRLLYLRRLGGKTVTLSSWFPTAYTPQQNLSGNIGITMCLHLIFQVNDYNEYR